MRSTGMTFIIGELAATVVVVGSLPKRLASSLLWQHHHLSSVHKNRLRCIVTPNLRATYIRTVSTSRQHHACTVLQTSILQNRVSWRIIPAAFSSRTRIILYSHTRDVHYGWNFSYTSSSFSTRCHDHHTFSGKTENMTTTGSNMKLSRQSAASVAALIIASAAAATMLSFQPIPICHAEGFRFFSSSSSAAAKKTNEAVESVSTQVESDKDAQHAKRWVEETSTTTTKNSEQQNSDSNNHPSFCPLYGCPLKPVDVHYNTVEYKAAFTALREDKRTVVREYDAATMLSSSANDQHATLTLIGYKGGTLQGQINQDRAFIVAPYSVVNNNNNFSTTTMVGNDASHTEFSTSQQLNDFLQSERILLGVFDGHAPLGEKVSEYVTVELPKLLAEKLSYMARKIAAKKPNGSNLSEDEKVQLTKRALTDTFIELDRNAPADPSGGCTASIVLKQDGKVYVANAGDSRSFVAAYRPSTKNVTIAYISREDKPSLPDERARVEAHGGQVYIPNRGTSRVVYHDPITGAPTGLAMSRSIGDWEAGKMGVIPDPIVDVLDINNVIANVLLDDIDDEQDSDAYQASPMLHAINGEGDDVYLFAVSATDGMMDYLSAIEISRVLAHSLFDDAGAHPVTAVEHLIFAAANAWQEAKQGRYRDDIAIAVSVLHQPHTTRSEKGSATIYTNGHVDVS